MKQRMEGRKMIKIRNISHQLKSEAAVGDWVTIGVVVGKLPPRYGAYLKQLKFYMHA